ncbi:1-aminocyclopropane-1-carboxylate synthase [Aureococcus anophagefferens]|nr:1-aminocyclopropane-1-carboxylate synthase [Aureococcus anophagefferens]
MEEEDRRARRQENAMEPPPKTYPSRSARRTSSRTRPSRSSAHAATRKKFLPADEQDVLPEDYPEAAVEEPPQPVIEGPKDEDDISKLLHSSMFLRLDESRLPIETFDSLEFEEKDKLPWLATGLTTETGDVLGFAAYFVAGGKDERGGGASARSWATSRSKQYKVQMGQKIKLRREAAARLDYFVAEQPATAVRAIQQSTLRGIHGKINDGLPVGPGRMTFPEPGTPGGALLRALTADVIQAYARAMKRAIVRQRYRNDPAFTDEYDSLKLPSGAVGAPPVAPAQGQGVRGAQERHCRDFAATLRNDWRTAFAEQIVDNIQDVFDFFQSSGGLRPGRSGGC